MKRRIAVFLACFMALSSAVAVGVSAAGYANDEHYVRDDVIPEETDWRDNPEDTGHCCEDVPYSEPYFCSYPPPETDPTEGDTNHCIDPPGQPHHYSDIEDETCYCGEHHPLPKPIEPAESIALTDAASTQTEPAETLYIAPPTDPGAKPDPLKKYRTYLYERWGEQVEVNLFEKLGNDCYLTHYTARAFNPATLTKCVDRYVYIADGSDKSVFIYDAKNNLQYELHTAYECGLISKGSLKKAFEMLAENPSTAKLKVNTCVLTAGKQARKFDAYRSGKGFFLDSDNAAGKIRNSDPTVAKLVKDKSGVSLVGLRKGTTILSRKLSGGREISCRVTVKSSPKLSKASLSVKKGKTVSVKIYGKAPSVDNKYTNTSKAEIISGKSADKIKIRGLKRGTTTLKVKVNGVVLKLKIKVK